LVGEALDARCDGVVASVQEAGELRRVFRDEPFEIVCPGIRPAWACRDDQRRIGTPARALAAGADALVIGRPITAARDPRAATQRILREMEDGC
jgi:orotidine-5'-phosphate decarboxylase